MCKRVSEWVSEKVFDRMGWQGVLDGCVIESIEMMC